MDRNVDTDLAILTLHERVICKGKGKAGEYSASNEDITILEPRSSRYHVFVG